MEFQHSNSGVLLGRKTFKEESVKDPHTNITYTRVIYTEELYVSDQRLYLYRMNVGNAICSDNNTRLPISESRCVNLNRACDKFHEDTPMEVDLNSSKERLINTIRTTEQNHLRKRRNEIPTSDNIEINSILVPIKKPSVSSFCKVSLIIISLLIFIGVYLVIAGEYFINVDKKLLIHNLKSDLKETLHYQDEALKVIIKNIERMEIWNEGIKVLPFIGTTGVGKTFTVNIFKKHFFPQLVHEVTNINNQQNIINNLHSCCNLIIVDNLKAYDLNDFLDFIEKLPKSRDILIIPIFNIQDTTDGVTYHVSEEDFKLIREKFDKSDFYYDLVIYDVLDYPTIEKWLREELYRRQIDESRHDKLIQNILNRDGIKHKGFKGLNLRLLLSLNK